MAEQAFHPKDKRSSPALQFVCGFEVIKLFYFKRGYMLN
jgi:hypothetical protein